MAGGAVTNGLQLPQTGRKLTVPARLPPAPGPGGCSSLRTNWWAINVCFSRLFGWLGSALFPSGKNKSRTSPPVLQISRASLLPLISNLSWKEFSKRKGQEVKIIFKKTNKPQKPWLFLKKHQNSKPKRKAAPFSWGCVPRE